MSVACREDIGFTLDFLRPVLEFGLLKPFLDYICWISEVLTSRGMPSQHVRDMLAWIGEFFEAELEPADFRLLNDALIKAAGGIGTDPAISSRIDENMPEPWAETDELARMLLAGDARAVRALFDSKLQAGLSLLQVEVHLLQPAMYQIGREWQNNEVSVAQEHLATATALTAMAQAHLHVEIPTVTDKKVLCACVATNQHVVGLQIVSDAFEANGWDVMLLGADVPTPDLIRQIQLFAPSLVCLSVSMPEHLSIARDAISRMREVLGDQVPGIMLGGLAINGIGAVVETLGADFGASDAEGVLRDLPE